MTSTLGRERGFSERQKNVDKGMEGVKNNFAEVIHGSLLKVHKSDKDGQVQGDKSTWGHRLC